MQYRRGAPEPSDALLVIILRAYNNLGVRSTQEVRATPIKKILKKLNLRRWISSAERIAARLNGLVRHWAVYL